MDLDPTVPQKHRPPAAIYTYVRAYVVLRGEHLRGRLRQPRKCHRRVFKEVVSLSSSCRCLHIGSRTDPPKPNLPPITYVRTHLRKLQDRFRISMPFRTEPRIVYQPVTYSQFLWWSTRYGKSEEEAEADWLKLPIIVDEAAVEQKREFKVERWV